jgi:hypothetical protein
MSFKDFTTKLITYDFQYDGADTKELQFVNSLDLASFLKDENFEDFEEKQNRICIKRNKLPFVYFNNEDEFINQVKDDDFNKPILIDNYKNNYSHLYFENNFTYLNDELSNINLIINGLAVKEVKAFFKDLSNKEKYGIEIVDNYSNSNLIITFISLKDKTKVNLHFKPTGTLKLSNDINYYTKVNSLIKYLVKENKQFSIFLKNSIISNLLFEEKDVFTLFFEKIDKIFYEAKLNYNVFLHELSLDKIKTDYKEYKQKYFASQNDILSKLTTQVVALPVSIAASAFSIYNLKGDIFPTMIIVFGLICYVIYVTFTLSIFYNDIYSLNKLAQRDYTTLKTHPFFVDNPNELSFFDEIKDNIFNRLKSLKIGLNIFVFMVWASFTMLAFYSLKTLSIELKNPIILFLIIASIFTLTYVNLLNKEELENN